MIVQLKVKRKWIKRNTLTQNKQNKLTQNYFLPDQPGRLVELEGGDPGDVDWDVHHCRW